MRIATYNVNGVNGRLPQLLQWLEETGPDVVCLQEIKTDDAKCPTQAIEAAGYAALWHGQRSHHGVAILSRTGRPDERRRGLPGDPDDRQARYLEAQVSGIVVASIYLPNGNPQPGPKFDYKLAWFERLIAHVQSLYALGQPVVLAGDFNVVPTNADIYNAWAWRFDAVMQPQSRDAYRRLLEQGWSDVLREWYPKERVYTFWVNARAFERNAGFRMDFMLANAALRPLIRGAGVDATYRGRERASDHAPVWIDVEA
jgi:exodeoxyribonuclease-3